MSNLINKAQIKADVYHDYGSINVTIGDEQRLQENKSIELLGEEEWTMKMTGVPGVKTANHISNSADMLGLPGDDDDLDDDEDDEIDLDEELEIETDEVDVDAVEIDDEDTDDLIDDDDDDDDLDDDDIL